MPNIFLHTKRTNLYIRALVKLFPFHELNTRYYAYTLGWEKRAYLNFLIAFPNAYYHSYFYEKRKVFQWIMYYVNLNAREKRDVRNVY